MMTSSETSMASVMVPAPVWEMTRPLAVVTPPAPEACKVTKSPVEDETRSMPEPVPAFSMDTTEPDEVA
ncbi:MAG: hypothetical protein AABX25_02580 [Nanoarchaeota archaeon]